ncbi:hypothetical protein EYA84_00730 [Verrucosispora sp. SN26_14.1]|uniref:hypothetical protein n=1 Tax=Verrucosispora sp. SN26_14.1 TaxID=2527879 RepID=UPI0010353D35|nr:hypothetical protein [Verrucosispora sp. SN26_14.1]TBL45338.1 hypothetical protein EYA84_00730 [Verrucosispora sp. SN26_14.1]
MDERLDLEDLVRRAKVGEVSNREVGRVAEVLRGPGGSETYRLLYVLLRVGAREHEDLAARYIRYSPDPQVAALALNFLCVHWKLFRRYRSEVVKALNGMEWDSLDELKQAAISATGEYLRSASDQFLLDKIIKLAESYEFDLSGRFAVEALARALGEPRATAVFPRGAEEGREWAQSILQRANARLRVDPLAG